MKKIILLLIATAGIVSCSDDALMPSGRIITEDRALETFTKINIHAGKTLRVEYGDDYGISITGSDNLVRNLESRVSNGQLSLGYRANEISHEDLEITITLPYFTALKMHGKRTLTTHGTFDFTDEIAINCYGENSMKSVDTFEAGHVDVELTGSGVADFRNLSSATAEAEITGSGKIYVNPSESLDAKIEGSGTIYYVNDPQVTSDVRGSGSITKL